MSLSQDTVSVKFEFPRTQVEEHPLCGRLRASRSRIWAFRAAATALAVSLSLAAVKLGKPMQLAQIFPIFLALDLMLRTYQLRGLRRSGLLRDICLTGQPALVTIAAFQEGARDHIRSLLALASLCTILPFGLGRQVLFMLPFLLIAVAVATVMLWRQSRPGPMVDLHRESVVRLLRPDNMMMVPFVLIAASTLMIFTMTLNGTTLLAIFGSLIVAFVLFLLIDRRQDRVRKLSDADFQAWVEEWCVGLTPGAPAGQV